MELAGRRVWLAETRRAPQRYRALFEKARAEQGQAFCLCCPTRPPLVISRRGDLFWVACWPGGRAAHEQNCWFARHDDAPDVIDDPTETDGTGGPTAGLADLAGPHHDDVADAGPADSGRASYSRSALRDLGGGLASIRLADALLLRPGANPGTGTDAPFSVGGQRRRMGLRGLQAWVWETAELHTLGPPAFRRTWAEASAAARAAAHRLTVNGEPLARSLYVVPPYHPDTAHAARTAFDEFTATLTSTRDGVRRGLILGAIREVSPSPHGHRIQLRHHPIPLYLSTALLDRMRRAAPPAFSDRRPDRSERVLLALVERSPGGYLVIVNGAVMLTSKDLIPSDSSWEVMMADALAAARRPFTKPLHYDATDITLPDYLIHDPGRPTTIVEVWGITGRADYEQRRRAKTLAYAAAGVPLVEWHVTDPLPDLTAAAAAD